MKQWNRIKIFNKYTNEDVTSEEWYFIGTDGREYKLDEQGESDIEMDLYWKFDMIEVKFDDKIGGGELKNMSLEEAVEWFNDKYCNNCESIILTESEAYDQLGFGFGLKCSYECGYCELHQECRYFGKELDGKDILELWSEKE